LIYDTKIKFSWQAAYLFSVLQIQSVDKFMAGIKVCFQFINFFKELPGIVSLCQSRIYHWWIYNIQLYCSSL